MKKKEHHTVQSKQQSSSPVFFEREGENSFFKTDNTVIQSRGIPGTDPIHSSLLDQYSAETGAPRDSATQHDPAYEAWLLGRSASPTTAPVARTGPINIVLDMNYPATDPTPNYTRDEIQLGAWERANYLLNVQQSAVCDHIINNGVESSFVTDVTIRFTQSDFEYFIARHIYENMNDRGREVSERIVWRQIHGRIMRHAHEHFVRYRQMTDQIRQDFLQRFSALPNRNSPIQIPQHELESYMTSLLQFLVARMQRQLWQTTCDWERTDYPVLLRGIPNVGGRFVPACGSPPVVPPEPILPVIVTPRGGRQP